MIKILFIIPYKDIEIKVKNLIKDVKDERVQIETTHVIGTQESLIHESNADIIIARGVTCLALKKKRKDISTIEIAVTGYDIIRAINSCKKKFNARKIAIIGPESIVYEVNSLEEIMDVNIKVLRIKDEKDAKKALRTAEISGIEAIVGGLMVCDIAKEMGFNAISLKTGEEAIRGAIREALNAANAAIVERTKAELIKSILQNTKEAIVAVDKSGIISEFNKAAYKTLDIPRKKNMINQPIKDILPTLNLHKDLENSKENLGVISTINGKKIISNHIPIKVASDNVGILYTFQNIDHIQEMESKIRKELNSKGMIAKYSFGNIIGNSQALTNAILVAYKYSQVQSNILIIGDTGTGKELFAQSIHNASDRNLEPFVAVNCAAVPENLLESELFGYVDGAFSGAVKGGKMGLFELAHKGTIFLDEIGELPLNLQAKLLRVLQEREIRKVGDSKVVPIDVRVIAATNRNLNSQVAEGKFRQDLLYRLDVLNLTIPALKERNEDIKDIANHFIKKYCTQANKTVPKFSKEAIKIFNEYSWPGNVRELRNICERLVVICDGDKITKEDIMSIPSFNTEFNNTNKVTQNQERSDNKKDELEDLMKIMDLVKVNKEDMAKLMGISRTTLWRRLKEKS